MTRPTPIIRALGASLCAQDVVHLFIDDSEIVRNLRRGLSHWDVRHDALYTHQLRRVASIGSTVPSFTDSKMSAILPSLVVTMARRKPSGEPFMASLSFNALAESSVSFTHRPAWSISEPSSAGPTPR